MLTGLQIRAARAALGWTAQRLAAESGTGFRTVVRLEKSDGIPSSHTATLQKIKMTLESAGIEFIGTPEDGPGIRLRS